MSDDKQGYLLSRGFRPSARLNYQHQLWRSALEFDLHPQIPTKAAAEPLRVAAICCGTGIFLSTLSLTLPQSAILHGYDISSDQFPHPSSLPANVELNTCDALSEPPEKLRGTYDVVHVRLLIAVVENDDPSKVLKHARALLKPGGYFQWDEMDPASLESTVNTATPALAQIKNIFQHAKPTGWVVRLPSIYKENGFEVTVTEVYKQRPWQSHMFMEIWCLVTDDYATDIDERGEQEKAKQIRQLVSQAWDEVKKGGYYDQCMRVVVGKAV